MRNGERAGQSSWWRETERCLDGPVTAYYGDDSYADFAYFTSEADAREGEQREVPPETAGMLGDWERVMKVDRFLDVPNPWLMAGR